MWGNIKLCVFLLWMNVVWLVNENNYLNVIDIYLFIYVEVCFVCCCWNVVFVSCLFLFKVRFLYLFEVSKEIGEGGKGFWVWFIFLNWLIFLVVNELGWCLVVWRCCFGVVFDVCEWGRKGCWNFEWFFEEVLWVRDFVLFGGMFKWVGG